MPLIAEAVRKAGMDSSALDGLAGLISGEISPAEWMSRVRQAERARRDRPPEVRPREESVPQREYAWPVSDPDHGPARMDESKAELDRASRALPRHLRDVYSYAYYRVGNHHDAEDLTEQTFLQAYRHFERAQRDPTAARCARG